MNKKRAEKEQQFGTTWYIINAAKHWFGFEISFNMAATIKSRMHRALLGMTDDERPDDILESVIIDYHKEYETQKD